MVYSAFRKMRREQETILVSAFQLPLAQNNPYVKWDVSKWQTQVFLPQTCRLSPVLFLSFYCTQTLRWRLSPHSFYPSYPPFPCSKAPESYSLCLALQPYNKGQFIPLCAPPSCGARLNRLSVFGSTEHITSLGNKSRRPLGFHCPLLFSLEDKIHTETTDSPYCLCRAIFSS